MSIKIWKNSVIFGSNTSNVTVSVHILCNNSKGREVGQGHDYLDYAGGLGLGTEVQKGKKCFWQPEDWT